MYVVPHQQTLVAPEQQLQSQAQQQYVAPQQQQFLQVSKVPTYNSFEALANVGENETH